jgi:phenylacetate-coenzyme A ligase PaaK-like adenylate-forming protein
MQNKLNTYNSLKKKLFTDFSFEELALEVFNFQYKYNVVYKKFVDHLGISPQEINNSTSIPFLPIEFFKSEKITCDVGEVTHVFESSGTSDETNKSKHYISDIQLYNYSSLQGFKSFYGDPSRYNILGLLPSYLERENASLVYMVNYLIHESGNLGGFFLDDFEQLRQSILESKRNQKIPLIFGVSFALLDFAEAFPGDYSKAIFLETGGMKGRKQEMVRAELHQVLKNSFHVQNIHSEYGMTEMLSQAYSSSEGIYTPSKFMRVFVRDVYNPFNTLEDGRGLINIIDLANLGTCSFIATQDVGEVIENNQFSISGRADNSEIRGCNLMVGDW